MSIRVPFAKVNHMSKLTSVGPRSKFTGGRSVYMYYSYVKGRKKMFVNNIQYNRVILEVFRWETDMM